MSWLSDSAELIGSGWLSSRYDGHGVRGADVPTGGEWEPILLSVLNMPSDSNSEFRIQLLSQPSAGTLIVNEDSSLSFTAPDGSYQLTAKAFKDGVEIPGTILVQLDVGVVPSTYATIKVWNGTQFVAGKLKIWNGTSFVPAILKRWNGSSFELVNR